MGVVTFLLLTGRAIFFNDWQVLEYAAGKAALPLDLLQQHESVNESGCNFVRDLLQTDPERRPTASSARKHEWLQNLHGDEDVDEQDVESPCVTSPQASSAVSGVSRQSPSTASNSWSATELQTSNMALVASASTGPEQWPVMNGTNNDSGADFQREQVILDANGRRKLGRSQMFCPEPTLVDEFNTPVVVVPAQEPAEESNVYNLKLTSRHEALVRVSADEAAFPTGISAIASEAISPHPEDDRRMYKPPLRESPQTPILPPPMSRGELNEKLTILGAPSKRWQVVRGNQTKQDLRSVEFSADGR
ncbi:hypothetical protein CB0940_12239 [Cercospora beticola]|uniref:Protein kinase domain-containing protein n=2 Tax=Cercospora beticola TaxID=122368 RepID=A0A2G5H5Q3_CERBT|nr:hypothetical protein CB0940_12239 [Cercospora beticola]PIA87870.1 hypothetical protein CB0940_12239 [Cercospora beticola]